MVFFVGLFNVNAETLSFMMLVYMDVNMDIMGISTFF